MSQSFSFLDCIKAVQRGENVEHLIPFSRSDTQYAGHAGIKVIAGTGTLVTGSVVIATGLNSVTAFTATLNSSGSFATGATQTAALRVTSITTGAVTVQGIFHSFVTGAATTDASGTASFYWIAYGT